MKTILLSAVTNIADGIGLLYSYNHLKNVAKVVIVNNESWTLKAA
jgi:hypothetical protein